MFQQRHFEAIAQMMQGLKPRNDIASATLSDEYLLGALREWQSMRDAFCELFARHNSNFMTDRFIQACEPGANVRARGTQRAKGSGYSTTSYR